MPHLIDSFCWPCGNLFLRGAVRCCYMEMTSNSAYCQQSLYNDPSNTKLSSTYDEVWVKSASVILKYSPRSSYFGLTRMVIIVIGHTAVFTHGHDARGADLEELLVPEHFHAYFALGWISASGSRNGGTRVRAIRFGTATERDQSELIWKEWDDVHILQVFPWALCSFHYSF